MRIVIDKDSMIKIIAIPLYVASGGDYDKATKTANELLEEMGYTELPRGHGDLIDRNKLRTHERSVTDGNVTWLMDVYLPEEIDNAHAIIEADTESEEV